MYTITHMYIHAYRIEYMYIYIYMYIWLYMCVCLYMYLYMYIYICMYYVHMAFDLNSFTCKPPFFAEKTNFANLSWIPRLSFAEVSYFAKYFAKKYFRELRRNFRRVSCWNSGGLCNGDGPLDWQSKRNSIHTWT